MSIDTIQTIAIFVLAIAIIFLSRAITNITKQL